ncbi:hypothetical protein GCM10009122_42820 [Fulvivirga kasyanovii]
MDDNYEGLKQGFTAEILVDTPIYQINAGGWTTEANWQKDTQTSPSPYFSPPSYRAVSGIDSPFYFEKSRITDGTWSFPVTSGDYVVTLHFIENPNSAQVPGSRVFDVSIEDRLALNDFDVVNFAGKGVPISLSFVVNTSDDTLNINFSRVKKSSLISAIEISASIGAVPNQDPVLSKGSYVLHQTIKEGRELRIPIIATDYDSPADSVKLLGGSIWDSVSFYQVLDYGAGLGEIVIKPDFDDAGGYLLYVAAEDEDGFDTGCQACWALIDLTVEDTPVGEAFYRVNAGDWIAEEDTPVDWERDARDEPHPFHNIGRFHSLAHNLLSNPTDAPNEVLDRSRVNIYTGTEFMNWNFPVVDGVYTAKLYFVESYFNVTNQRIFNISIEDQLALSNFEILTETDKDVPIQKNLTAEVTDGYLTIVFENIKSYALITAIEIAYAGPVTAQEEFPETHAFGQDAISVYPNPVKNQVTFKLPEPGKEPVSVKLSDSYGQIWFQSTVQRDHLIDEVNFPVPPSIPSGIYHAEIVIGNRKQIVRLVKK